MTEHELYQLDLLLTKLEHELGVRGAPLSVRRVRNQVANAVTFLKGAR